MPSREPQADGATDRTLVKDFVGELRRPLFTFCAYCGRPCVGLTCYRHRGLPALDPNMPHAAAPVDPYPSGFKATCPNPKCEKKNPPGNFWCCECGCRLYLSENELKGRAA